MIIKDKNKQNKKKTIFIKMKKTKIQEREKSE